MPRARSDKQRAHDGDRQLTARQQHNLRGKIAIQAGGYIARLGKCVLGELEMDQTQIRAAEILLRKCLPDLTSTELIGDITHRRVVDEPMDVEQWAAQHRPVTIDHEDVA